MRALRAAALLFVLLAPTLAQGGVSAAESPPAIWWGPTGPDGWHARVPVVVENPHPHGVLNLPVRWEVDVAALLEDAGWPTRQVGDRLLARGFTLDPTSWRVVEYTNFLPPVRTGDGAPTVYDASAVGADRFVVPSSFTRGAVEARGAKPYDDATNPTGVLTWIVPGEIQGGGKRYFYVYFDRQEAGERPAAAYREQDLGRLQAQYYLSRGNVLFGYGRSVVVTATEPNTEVTVLVYSSSSRLQPHEPSPRSALPNPFRISQGTTVEYALGARDAPFVVTATRPVVAESGSGGFVPSTDDALAGRSFDFRASGETVYLVGSAPGTRVQVTTGGRTETFALNPWAAVSTEAGNAVTARLTAGASYLVQDANPVLGTEAVDGRPAIQVPSVHGAPAGFEHTAATSSWRAPFGDFRVVAPSGPAGVRVVSIERSVQIEPPGSPEEPFPPPRALEPGSPWVRPYAAADPVNPIAHEASREAHPILVYGGRARDGLRSALGGVDARAFDVPYGGGYTAFAYYNDTRINLVLDGTASSPVVLNALNRYDFQAQSGFRLEATKPIALLPRASVGYLPGYATTLPHVVGTPEVRGAAVSLRSLDSDAEPVLKGGGPGASVTFRFQVQNLGRDATGSLTDTVHLTIENASIPWDVTVEPSEAVLATGEATTVDVIVDVPHDGAVGTDFRFALRATSGVNPNVHDEMRALVVTRTVHDVALAFGEPGGPKSLTTPLKPGQGVNLTLAVTNRGSGNDTFDLNVTRTSADFDAELLHDSAPLRNVTLAPGATASLTLRVSTPVATRVPLSAIEVVAQSRASAAASDKLILTVELREEGAIRIVPQSLIAFTEPGSNATINLSILNDGNIPASLAFDETTVAPPGWSSPRILYRGAEIHEVNDFAPSRLNGPLNLTIEIPVPENATAFSAARVLFRVEQQNLEGQRVPVGSIEVLGLSRRVMSFTLEGATEVGVAPGATHELTYRLVNRGNGIENATLSVTGLPAGWAASPKFVPDLAPGDAAVVHVPVHVPAFAAPEKRPGLVEIRTQVDGTARFPFNLTVNEKPHVALGLAREQRVPAGLPYALAVTLANEGNAREPVSLNATFPEGWSSAPLDALALPPAASRTVAVAFTPPVDAVGEFTVVIEATQRNVTTRAEVVLTVVPPVPRISEILNAPRVADVDPGRPILVSFVVENPSEVDLPHVTIELRLDGEVADRVEIENLPAGASRIATLKATPAKRPSVIEVVLDPDERFSIRADDRSVIVSSGRAFPIPDAGVVLFAAAFLGAALLHRRRGRGME